MVECISWILGGKEAEYNDSLTSDASIEESEESAIRFRYSDAFTLDATIIATVLGQLVDEGRVDIEAKPFAKVALDRQSHPRLLEKYRDEPTIAERRAILQSVQQVIDAA